MLRRRSAARLSFALTLVTCVGQTFGVGPALAFDGQFVPIEGGAWDVDNGPIEYVLEPNGSDDIDDGSDLDALRDAFRAWECVEGTTLRFVEGAGPGPATIDGEDGQNTLFWDETGAFGMGPATLGVTVGDAGGGKRASADIVFNGSDSAWSTDGTAVDVMSIALHEIGHFVGLDHPCDKAGGQETNCNGPERSVMTPAWSGELERAPLPDDEAGIVALYPAGADDESGCDGPFRKGERCSCDGECVEGLVCSSVVGSDAPRTCAATCTSDNSDCGDGFTCVLDAPAGDEPANGVCVKLDDAGAPQGAVCSNGNQCASGTCVLLFDLTRSLCQVPCDTSSDCDGGTCYEGFCLGAAFHEECAEPEQGCACSTGEPTATGASRSGGVGLLAGGLLAGLMLVRRRRHLTDRARGTRA